MKKTLLSKSQLAVFLFLVFPFMMGCGRNYSGKYLYVDQQLKRFLQDGSGRLYDPDGMAAMALIFRNDVKETYKFMTVKSLLILDQKGKDVSGKLSVTLSDNVVDFVVRTGYKADKTGLLHLDLTLDPQAAGGIGALMGLMGNGNNLLIKMDEVKSKSRQDLSLSIEDPYDVFIGVSRVFPKDDHFSFQKIELSELDTRIDERIKQIHSHALDVLKLLIDEKNTSGAKKYYSALLDSKIPVPDDVKSKMAELSKRPSK